MRSRSIVVMLAIMSPASAVAATPDAGPPAVTSAKPLERLFAGTDPHQLPTVVKGHWQEAVADCGVLKRADRQHDGRMRVPPPAEPESRSRVVVPRRCKP